LAKTRGRRLASHHRTLQGAPKGAVAAPPALRCAHPNQRCWTRNHPRHCSAHCWWLVPPEPGHGPAAARLPAACSVRRGA
jgi:hypothetical protein